MRGPGIFLAQFVGDQPPFNSLASISEWAAGHGYKGLQIPTSESRFIDLEKAASSQDYCDELKGTVAEHGLEITELSTHLQGQLVAVHPAYDELFAGFAPAALKGDPAGRTEWAISQLKMAARASERLGLAAHATFSGSFLWHLAYPWPPRPAGLVEMGFAELAKRWLPILDAFDEAGVDLCYEIHPGEDLHDGVTFERFLEATDTHSRAKILYDPSHFVLQQLDYLAFIDLYHDLIKAFHVKDAEFIASGRSGVYGGYQDWIDRPGRFRSVGDGQIDFGGIFSRFAQYGYSGWAVLEWECCLKNSEQGAIEGAPFIKRHMIETATTAFDDFVSSESGTERNKRLLGLS